MELCLEILAPQKALFGGIYDTRIRKKPVPVAYLAEKYRKNPRVVNQSQHVSRVSPSPSLVE
jgi:hypothetical protein